MWIFVVVQCFFFLSFSFLMVFCCIKKRHEEFLSQAKAICDGEFFFFDFVLFDLDVSPKELIRARQCQSDEI